MKKNIFTLEKKRSFFGYVFTLPWVIGFAAFQAFPLILSFMLSVSYLDSPYGLQMHFIAADNYIAVFTENVDFAMKFFDTAWRTMVYTPFIVVLSIVIALLLNQKIKGRSLFRVIFFLPVLLGSGVIMQQLGDAANILHMPMSVERYINYYFAADIADKINGVLSEVIRLFWETGVQIIILLGGLQSIPDSYYEAARVDNANSWDMLWKITLPILSPMIFLTTIYTLIDSFRSESNEISAYIIDVSFKQSKYTEGAAMGWLYFAIVAFVVAMTMLIFRKQVYYEK